jgi:hypothetical protein
MKAKRFLLTPIFALAAAGVFAEQSGLTRQEVRDEVTKYNEIRQALEQRKEIAVRYGCDFSAVSFDINAKMKCNALIERIAPFEGSDAMAKVEAFAKAQGIK